MGIKGIEIRSAGLIAVVIGMMLSGCGTGGSSNILTATPAKGLTSADVAKLKWIEGIWRGMNGEKPFYERYRLENDSLVVEALADGDPARIEDSGRFELKDGVFGKRDGDSGSAATFITDSVIQFVPIPAGKGNAFRFERESADKWRAVLEWIDKEGKPQQKVYQMERWTSQQ